jgi:tetratricopeptide (TPR) repeat protein
MNQIEQIINDDDDKEHVRILNDDEYARALNQRHDIFLIEKNKWLAGIEAATLVIVVIAGLWLSSTHAVKVSPDFYQKRITERMAKLRHGSVLSSTTVKKTLEKASGGSNPDQTGSEAATKAHSAILSKAEYSASRARHDAIPPLVKVRGGQAPAGDRKSSATDDDTLVQRPEDETSLLNLGNANKTHGDRTKAFSAFRRVLKQNPRNTTALSGMGDLFLFTGLLDSAADFYTAALRENPRIPAARNGLGSVRYYLSVMATNPNFTTQRKIQDPARYRQEQYDSAIAEYTTAISLDSSKVDALTNRGVILDNHGEHSAALADYSRAIKIKPTYAEAYDKRAETYKSLGKFKDAIADYTAAIKLDSSSYEFDPTLHFANAYFGRGNVEFQAGNYEKAISDFDSALALSPNHSLAMLNKARALVDAKQVDSAIVWYTRAIAVLSPKEYGGAQERAYFGRGVAYNLINQSVLALQDFNAAIRLKTDDYFTYFHRGNAFKALAKYSEAIADYARTLSFPKLASKASWRIAECYALKLDKPNALIWLKKSISYGFTNIKIWNQDRDLEFLWDDKEFLGFAKGP